MYNRNIGKIGEDCAIRFLVKQGFRIIERNYLRRWGEIDIVAEKDTILYFFEAKSIVCKQDGLLKNRAGWNPAENIHKSKKRRLQKTIQTYLIDHSIDPDRQLSVESIIVYLDMKKRVGHIRMIENLLV